jgi:hypothetical protein
VLFLQIDALLRSCQKEHVDRTELLHTAVKTADLGILLGAPLSNGDFSMTRVAGLLSDALSALSSGQYSYTTTNVALQYLMEIPIMSVLI